MYLLKPQTDNIFYINDNYHHFQQYGYLILHRFKLYHL